MKEFWKKLNKIEIGSAFLASLIILMSGLDRKISINNIIYAIGQIHEYDRTVFESNMLGGAGCAVSPRYVLDKIFSFFMHINGGVWQNVVIPYVYLSVAILAAAIVSIVFRMTRNNRLFLAALLSFMFLANSCGQVGGFTLFTGDVIESIGVGMGFALAVLAVSFVVGEEKNFNAAWIIVALAACIHIHEGLYGFATIFVIAVADTINKKEFHIKNTWTIAIAVVVFLVVVLPNMITDHLNISNEEFVYIYANFRHPHHLVPSTWDRSAIIKSLMLIVLSGVLRAGCLYFKNRMDTLRMFGVEFGLFVASWIGAIGIMYIGTEKLKLVSITTIFITKYLKYVGLMAIIWYIRTAIELFADNNLILGLGILTFAFSAKNLGYEAVVVCAILLLWIYFVINNYDGDRLKGRYDIYVLLAGILFVMMDFKYAWGWVNPDIKIVFFLVITAFLSRYIWKTFGIKIFRYVTIALCVLTIGCGLRGDIYDISGLKVTFRTPTTFLINACGKDIYELAIDFAEATGKDETFLADPDDSEGAGWFQIVAQRNCYVLYKVVPSSKSMMKEWYDRYMTVQGIFDKPIEEIESIMDTADIEYILVDSGHFELFDTNSNFEVYRESINGKYRMYKHME